MLRVVHYQNYVINILSHVYTVQKFIYISENVKKNDNYYLNFVMAYWEKFIIKKVIIVTEFIAECGNEFKNILGQQLCFFTATIFPTHTEWKKYFFSHGRRENYKLTRFDKIGTMIADIYS